MWRVLSYFGQPEWVASDAAVVVTFWATKGSIIQKMFIILENTQSIGRESAKKCKNLDRRYLNRR